MQIDPTAASAAAPTPDATAASFDTPAGAAGVFAALLDEAAGETAGEHAVTDEDSEDEDQFDEMAAWSMPSLLCLGVVLPVADPVTVPATDPATDSVGSHDVASATDISDRAEITDLTRGSGIGDRGSMARRAVLVDVGMSSQLNSMIPNDMGVDPRDTLVKAEAVSSQASMKDATAAPTSASTSAPKQAAPADVLAPPKSAQADMATPLDAASAPASDAAKNEIAASPGTADVDATRVSKASLTSRPTRSEPAKAAPKTDGAAPAETSHSAATPPTAIVEAAHTPERSQPSSEPRTAGATAARLARALERATAANAEVASAGRAVAESPSDSNASGQQSSFGDAGNRAAQSFAAVRQPAAGGVTFTVAAPTPIDARTLATVAAAPAGPVETAAATIPERDVLAQLVQSLRVQFRDGIGEAVVKLKPEHLGAVQISLKIENGTIKATVQAENPAVRQWLESQQDTLRGNLADHGLRLERFVVEPDGERSATAEDGQRQQREQQRRRQHRRMSEKDHPAFEVTV